MSKKNGKDQFPLWLNPAIKRRIKTLADLEGVTMTDYIEGIMRQFVNSPDAQRKIIESLQMPIDETTDSSPHADSPKGQSERQAKKKAA